MGRKRQVGPRAACRLTNSAPPGRTGPPVRLPTSTSTKEGE